MTTNRRTPVWPLVAVLAGASVAVGQPPREGKLDARPAGRFAAGDELEQAVAVSRRSAYQMAGTTLAQAARYTLTSKLTVTAATADGGATLKHTITDAQLVAADEAARPGLADALKQAVGTTFELTVGPTGDVTAFKGPKDQLRVQQGNALGGPTLRLWSVLDADAWKELAALTLFAPDPAANGPWNRPAAHDWGPLGSWVGRTTFTPKGKAGDAERYEFARALSHRPPAAGAANDLPATIIEPRFVVVAAGGTLRYDPKAGRVTAAEEAFRVRGTATVLFAGQAVRVEVEEEQGFEVRVRKPADAVLNGRPRR